MPSAVSGLWGQKFGRDVIGRPVGGSTLGRPGARGGSPATFGEFPFRSRRGTGSYKIAGVSRDVQGNVLPLCTVMLFETGTDKMVAKVVSEAVTGVFAFLVPNTITPYYAVFYLASSPAVAGTALNTLTGA